MLPRVRIPLAPPLFIMFGSEQQSTIRQSILTLVGCTVFGSIFVAPIFSQTPKKIESITPRVIIPTSNNIQIKQSPNQTANRTLYPWKLNITSTVFWIGEAPSQNNPVPNDKSSWDVNWDNNFGGFDNPEPSARIASHKATDFRPKAFIPKLNPFYIALPYNDKLGTGYRAEASKVIPWFNRTQKPNNESCLKGRWVQIYVNNRSCYAQWEDVGPFEVDDWEYVFGTKNPRTSNNGGAGIDLSPSVRDYLGITSGRKVHWRFVESTQVPYGPWKKYGVTETAAVYNDKARQEYFEYLRKVRDKQYRKKSSKDLQRR
jgi:hypothetical protein